MDWQPRSGGRYSINGITENGTSTKGNTVPRLIRVLPLITRRVTSRVAFLPTRARINHHLPFPFPSVLPRHPVSFSNSLWHVSRVGDISFICNSRSPCNGKVAHPNQNVGAAELFSCFTTSRSPSNG